MKILRLFILICIPMTAVANTTSSNFNYSGYIDGSYNYLAKSNLFTSGTYNRVYDITPNGFTLQQASLSLGYQPAQGLGAFINPIIGRDPYEFAPYGWNPYYGSQWLGFDIPQAYLQFVNGNFTLMAGEMYTLASYESVDYTKDLNFSRSILWGYATPTTTLGIRGIYKFNDQISLTLGLDNGWDNIRDASRRKTVEFNLAYTPSALYSFLATFYTGGQRAADRTDDGSQSIRNLLDLIATYNPNNKWLFAANYDYGVQANALLPAGNIAAGVWQGIAGYVSYQFNDKWQGIIRGEVFSDRDGYRTGVAQCWKEGTVTLAYKLFKSLQLRLETRHDFSNVDSIINANGITVSNHQQSYAFEALYQF